MAVGAVKDDERVGQRNACRANHVFDAQPARDAAALEGQHDRRRQESQQQRADREHAESKQEKSYANRHQERVGRLLALLREDDRGRDVKHDADDQQAAVVSEIDDEQAESATEMVEVRRREPLLPGPKVVERSQHPAKTGDRADDGNQLDQSHDQDLFRPLRVAERPDERVADAVQTARSAAVRRSPPGR